jgi:hypothetical protein
MSLAQQEFTNAGKSMLGRAQAGETLTISKIVIGNGSASQASDLWPLTALIGWKMDVTISGKDDYGDGTLLVEGSFLSNTAPAVFQLREVGIMAHIAAEADRLYSVANVFTDLPDTIDPASPSLQAFKIKLIIDRIPAANLVIQIGPSENVIGQNLATAAIGPGVYKDAAGNVLSFKRLAAGTGIELVEDTPQTYITIGQKVLKQNLDLYVPATYQNPPAGTQPEQFFATIQAAHDYLLTFHIPADKLATIHVDSGRFTQSVPINFSHPDSKQIQVIGRDITTKVVSGTITRAGALPNIDVTIPIPSGTSGIAVNDVVYLYDAPNAQYESCGYVTVVSPTSITVRMRIHVVLPPVSMAGSGKILVFPTQFSTSLTTGWLFNFPNGIGLFKNFALRSTTAQLGSGVNNFGNGTFENLVAVNFSTGFGVGGVTNINPLISANACQVGLQVGASGDANLGSPTTWARATFSGNITYGLWVVGGSWTGGGGTYTYACSNPTGIRCDTRGYCGISNSTSTGGYVLGYNDVGAVAAMLGIILSAINVVSTIQANVSWDLLAGNGGQISIVHNSTVSGRYSPALGVLGPSGGYNAMNL